VLVAEPHRPSFLTRLRAGLAGERDPSTWRPCAAGRVAYDELLAADRLRDQLPTLWSVPAAAGSQLLAAWNAFVLQTLGETFLDADYAARPGTAAYVPAVTYTQAAAWLSAVGDWVSRAPDAPGPLLSRCCTRLRPVTDRTQLRQTFNEDAERYDRARPGYPPELYDRLPPPPARILEIGCGTGQATRDLAARGHRITAIELGPQLAAVARRNLPESVDITVGAFEDWPLPAEPFDVVFAATAFHWIDPAVRVARSAAALRPGGMLATIATGHVLGGTVEFFVEVQRCYERFDPDTPSGFRQPAAADVPHDIEPLDGFEDVTFHRYEWDAAYTTEQYLDLLLTYSGHRALPDAARTGLLACIAGLIDNRYGGTVVKRYLTELRTATLTTLATTPRT
jgi:SAM-dependent methyltransferase